MRSERSRWFVRLEKFVVIGFKIQNYFISSETLNKVTQLRHW